MAAFFSAWIMQHIELFGYGAVLGLMALESANIPIPSEITLPFGGFLASQGKLNLHLVALFGGLGCLVGSIPSYWLGRKLGRPFLERYGKWFFLGPEQVALGDRWISRYGNLAAFVARLLPVVRTFISFIAGIWKVPFWPFIVLTFIGSWIWSYILAYIGFKLGERWDILQPYWHKFDVVIVLLVIGTILGYGWYHWKQASRPRAIQE